MSALLSQIASPADLQNLTDAQLAELAVEMRDELVRVLSIRPAHFASNLGVIELCLALHLTFDFSRDRLIWDTGHQIYPHKLITGRYAEFSSLRTRGGLMGYPNPNESDYDLFMTGHAGCSVSCALGLKAGDDLMGEGERRSVAVIGDGALPSGIVFEALNNAGGLRKDLLVILNDNEMSICPRVGALASCLDKARMTHFYQDSKRHVRDLLRARAARGRRATHALEQIKDGMKAFLTGGMLFEEMGFRYFGPVDGHDLPSLRRWLRDVKEQKGPVLLHVLTQKGHGVAQASADPVTYHTPPVFEKVGPERTILALKRGARGYTDAVSNGIHEAMTADNRVTVLTAAMCQGNKLEKVREEFPNRFFDVGICESHAVAFAAGMAKAGMRPIVDIYSTFLQRSFDQLFQEVALQNLPVAFCLDRAGLTGPDGPTHHGAFDIPYTRLFPNFVVMAPGDEYDVAPMLKFAPRTTARRPCVSESESGARRAQRDAIGTGPIRGVRVGRGRRFRGVRDIVCACVKAAQALREDGLNIGVVNARFAKPLDTATMLKAVEELPLVVTVEEGTLEGGFGSAVLEAANNARLDTRNIVRLGLPDRFVEHGERAELLAELGLDVAGLCATVRKAPGREAAVGNGVAVAR